jgi:ABC-type multidrug transport system ATPase subunit
VIIDHGKTIASGTPTEIKKRAGRNVVEVHVRAKDGLSEAAKALAQVGDGHLVRTAPTRSAPPARTRTPESHRAGDQRLPARTFEGSATRAQW